MAGDTTLGGYEAHKVLENASGKYVITYQLCPAMIISNQVLSPHYILGGGS